MRAGRRAGFLADLGSGKITKIPDAVPGPRDIPLPILTLGSVAGTPVLTADGLVPIESVQPGTEVWAYDDAWQERTLATVGATSARLYEGELVSIVLRLDTGAMAWPSRLDNCTCSLVRFDCSLLVLSRFELPQSSVAPHGPDLTPPPGVSLRFWGLVPQPFRGGRSAQGAAIGPPLPGSSSHVLIPKDCGQGLPRTPSSGSATA